MKVDLTATANLVKITQFKEARRLREAFIRTSDGKERIPTLQEFLDGIIESDQRFERECSEHIQENPNTTGQ